MRQLSIGTALAVVLLGSAAQAADATMVTRAGLSPLAPGRAIARLADQGSAIPCYTMLRTLGGASTVCMLPAPSTRASCRPLLDAGLRLLLPREPGSSARTGRPRSGACA